jgi:excisionase family DNA binding protein
MSDLPPSLLLSRRDAAHLLGISVDTLVNRLLKTGELSFVRIGKSVLIPRDELEALVERRRNETNGRRLDS